MKPYRSLAFVLALIMALTLAACGGNNDTPNSGDAPTTNVTTPPPSDNGDTADTNDEGTYEGDTDASGQRSGYGVWTYHNFRYEGNWENDMPNGEGTLFEAVEFPSIYIANIVATKGNWVDGYADGEITWTLFFADTGTRTFNFTVANGHVPEDIDVKPIENPVDEEIRTLRPGSNEYSDGIFGVPPFVDGVYTVPDIAPPSGMDAIASIPDTPDTSSVPDTSTPDDSIPDKSDWVGTYTNDFATISIYQEDNTYVVDIIKDGDVVHEDFLNVGRLVEPGGPLPAMGQHDDPWKSISEMMLLELSEDYQTLTLSVLDIPGGSGSWDYVTDDFLGDYTRQ